MPWFSLSALKLKHTKWRNNKDQGGNKWDRVKKNNREKSIKPKVWGLKKFNKINKPIATLRKKERSLKLLKSWVSEATSLAIAPKQKDNKGMLWTCDP